MAAHRRGTAGHSLLYNPVPRIVCAGGAAVEDCQEAHLLCRPGRQRGSRRTAGPRRSGERDPLPLFPLDSPHPSPCFSSSSLMPYPYSFPTLRFIPLTPISSQSGPPQDLLPLLPVVYSSLLLSRAPSHSFLPFLPSPSPRSFPSLHSLLLHTSLRPPSGAGDYHPPRDGSFLRTPPPINAHAWHARRRLCKLRDPRI